MSLLSKKSEFNSLFEVFKTVMIPTHGNAAVESGFCINSDILVEN